MASRRIKKSRKGHIEVSRINDEIDAMRFALDAGVSDPERFKLHLKQQHKQKKQERKARVKALKQAQRDGAADTTDADARKRVFVLDFKGDIRAAAVSSRLTDLSGNCRAGM